MIRLALSAALALGIAAPGGGCAGRTRLGRQDQVAGKKITGAGPHMIHQNTFYKELDVTR